MVPLEKKQTYLTQALSTPKIKAFYNLLVGISIPLLDEEMNESDLLFIGIVNSIVSNNRHQFDLQYEKKSRSNPTKDSKTPFVNDDFLIFCLIVGIIKFQLDKTWILNVLGVRTHDKTTITFENIVRENYFSKSNCFEVVLMFFQMKDRGLINDTLVNDTLDSISSNQRIFESRSDFLIICTICAYDLCIKLKIVPDGGEIKLLQEFNVRFLKRMKLVTWIIQLVVMIVFLYVMIRLLSLWPAIKVFFDKYGYVFALMGALGITFIGNSIPQIKKKSFELILRLFGYSEGLIKRSLR